MARPDSPRNLAWLSNSKYYERLFNRHITALSSNRRHERMNSQRTEHRTKQRPGTSNMIKSESLIHMEKLASPSYTSSSTAALQPHNFALLILLLFYARL